CAKPPARQARAALSRKRICWSCALCSTRRHSALTNRKVNEMITVQTGITLQPQEMKGGAVVRSCRLVKSGQSRRNRWNELIQTKCDECDARTVMVTAEHAADITGIRTRVIYRWVESGMVHFTETPDGETLVCLDSLSVEWMQCAQGDPAQPSVHANQIDQDSVMTAELILRDYSTRADAPSRGEQTLTSIVARAMECAECSHGDILIGRLTARADDDTAGRGGR